MTHDGGARPPLLAGTLAPSFCKEPWSLLWAKPYDRFQLEPCQGGGIG